MWLGIADEHHADRVITVHSMSKTDCLAGARLAVVEIRDEALRERFEAINRQIRPNIAAVLICYLFYRGTTQAVRTYWHLRNAIFAERTRALLAAVENLPPDRNPFGLVDYPAGGEHVSAAARQEAAGRPVAGLAVGIAGAARHRPAAAGDVRAHREGF